MDYREKLSSEKTGLRGIVLKIPGFRGYGEKELRREADKLLRSYLAARFQEQRNRLSELQVSLVKAKQLSAVSEIDRAATKLQHVIDRLKTASYGYAGWFDAVQVKEEDLDRLYQYDNELVAKVEQGIANIDALNQAISTGGDINAAVTRVSGLYLEINDALDRRGQVLYEG